MGRARLGAHSYVDLAVIVAYGRTMNSSVQLDNGCPALRNEPARGR